MTNMRSSIAVLLGLCVVLALTSTTLAGAGCKKGGRFMKCKKYMNDMSQEDKDIGKACWQGKTQAADGDDEDDAAGAAEPEGDSDNKHQKHKEAFRKMMKCFMEKKEILKDNKINKDKFDASIDAKFKDAERAAIAKKESAACIDATKTYTDDEFPTVMKCIWGAMAKACKDTDAATTDA